MSGVEKKRLSTEKASKIVIYKKQKNYNNLIQSKDFDTTIITINQQISPFTEPQKIFTLYVLPIYEMTRFQNHLLDIDCNQTFFRANVNTQQYSLLCQESSLRLYVISLKIFIG
ncbi:hypothetical protein JHK82_020511 [Glycine max]|uniref:Uncharacterized protein n=1 Tax=Glycine max TaxID=3847 RepID=K7L520_SOYBN|nr:hypothetical protein JHK87_020409 [Glycine soja]KAG5024610.1 hypothetical protein JHK86_020524 [Glycine max]KAG5135780.1 hypothetical protein JHK82_020511 [Glycine max]